MLFFIIIIYMLYLQIPGACANFDRTMGIMTEVLFS